MFWALQIYLKESLIFIIAVNLIQFKHRQPNDRLLHFKPKKDQDIDPEIPGTCDELVFVVGLWSSLTVWLSIYTLYGNLMSMIIA